MENIITDPKDRRAIENAGNLTSGPIVKTLFLFALPALGSNILQSINGSINAVWVGQFLGERGLAATANANLVMFMMLALVFGFGMASTILIGQSMGRRDLAGMRRAVGTGLSLFIVLGIGVSTLGWLVSPNILKALDTPADVYLWALAYLRVMFLGLPFALLTVYFAMALRGVGDSMTPLLLQLPGMVVDILLNPVLIEGWGGFPRLGIEGAGLATLVANLVSFLVMVGFIYRRDLPVRLRGAEWRYLVPEPKLLIPILRKGIPMGLQIIVMSSSALILLGFVNAEGTATVAAYGASTQIWTYLQMPAVAIGMAVSAMAAQNIGAGRWDRIGTIAKAGLAANIVMTGLLVLAIAVFDHAILGLFLPQHDEALAIAQSIGWIANWSFILMGAAMVFSAVTRANGAAIAPLIIMVLAYFPGRLGAILVFRPWLGVDAVWWSLPIGAAISLVLTVLYYWRGNWRDVSLIVSIEEAEEFVQSEAEPAGRVLPNA